MSGKHWCVQKVGGVVVRVQQSYASVEVHLGESHKLSYKGYIHN